MCCNEMKDKLIVAWVCNFSNSEIRSHLAFHKSRFDALLRRVSGSNLNIEDSDYGVWITNGIKEMKKFDNVELHVITPHYGVVGKTQDFSHDGIQYHVYSDESFQTFWKIRNRLGIKQRGTLYKKNRDKIKTALNGFNPDIIHFIGAENINYSLTALDLNNNVPVIVQLQTLAADPKVFSSLKKNGNIIKDGERRVLQRADYIFTIAKPYMSIIRTQIDPDAVFIANKLAVGVDVDRRETLKEYDFVYCSVDISKAADLAIQAFAIARDSFPNIKLDIIGHYSTEYKAHLDEIIEKKDLGDSVVFEGRLPTHDDVLNQMKKARFALLPLRPDLLPSTIREAMSVGCPVITTLTESTPQMNTDRESLVICNPDDANDIASKMCLLLTDSDYVARLRENAYKTVEERYDNYAAMKKTVDSYFAILDNFHNGTPIPISFLS